MPPRKLEDIKTLSFYDLSADEISLLRREDPAAYKAATEVIDTEAAAKPGERTKSVVNGKEVELESVTFRNGRRI